MKLLALTLLIGAVAAPAFAQVTIRQPNQVGVSTPYPGAGGATTLSPMTVPEFQQTTPATVPPPQAATVPSQQDQLVPAPRRRH